MEDLFTKYSPVEIIIFIIILAVAIKGFIDYFDWGKNRLNSVYDKEYKSKEDKKKLERQIEDLNKFFDEKEKVDSTFEKINETFKNINSRIDMLIESDKERIRAYITEKYNFFVNVQGWIDIYSLECIEKQYAIYVQEHGNSFVEGLVEQIRSLPTQPPDEE